MSRVRGWVNRSARALARHPEGFTLWASLIGCVAMLAYLLRESPGETLLCVIPTGGIALIATILVLARALRVGETGRRSTTLRLMAAIAILTPLYALPVHYWREWNREPCRKLARSYAGISARMIHLADTPAPWIDPYREDLRARSALAAWKGRQFEGASDFEGVLDRIRREGPDQSALDRSWSRFEAEAKARGFAIPTR